MTIIIIIIIKEAKKKKSSSSVHQNWPRHHHISFRHGSIFLFHLPLTLSAFVCCLPKYFPFKMYSIYIYSIMAYIHIDYLCFGIKNVFKISATPYSHVASFGFCSKHFTMLNKYAAYSIQHHSIYSLYRVASIELLNVNQLTKATAVDVRTILNSLDGP